MFPLVDILLQLGDIDTEYCFVIFSVWDFQVTGDYTWSYLRKFQAKDV